MIGGSCKLRELRICGKIWKRLGAEFLQIAAPFDFLDSNENVKVIEEVKKDLKLNFLFHLYCNGKVMYSPANDGAHDLMMEQLKKLDNFIEKNNFIRNVIIHLGEYKTDISEFPIFEIDIAIKNCKKFYERYSREKFKTLRLTVENVPSKKGNPIWDGLGFEANHFIDLLGDLNKFELCFDVGHFNLSDEKLSNFLKLPIKTSCLHLSGNDGTGDQHGFIQKSTFKFTKEIERMIQKIQYIILEIKPKNDEKTKLLVESLKKGELI